MSNVGRSTEKPNYRTLLPSFPNHLAARNSLEDLPILDAEGELVAGIEHQYRVNRLVRRQRVIRLTAYRKDIAENLALDTVAQDREHFRGVEKTRQQINLVFQ
jgi:hypothetical protein